MTPSKQQWAICPVDSCTFALELDPDENLYCPTCEMELVTGCPSCRAPIEEEEAIQCAQCGGELKE